LCGSNTSFARNFLLVILYWIIFMVFIVVFTNILSADQFINKLSTGAYMLKTLINYVIFITLIFEIF
jgi:uncharacterized membrane protein YhaH (DUF805 family)